MLVKVINNIEESHDPIKNSQWNKLNKDFMIINNIKESHDPIKNSQRYKLNKDIWFPAAGSWLTLGSPLGMFLGLGEVLKWARVLGP